MDSILQIISLVAIIAFIVSLSPDPYSFLIMKLIPEKFHKALRWTLGIVALMSVTISIVVI